MQSRTANETDVLLQEEENNNEIFLKILGSSDTALAAMFATLISGYADPICDQMNAMVGALLNHTVFSYAEGATFALTYFAIKYELEYQAEKKNNPSLERWDYFKENCLLPRALFGFPIIYLVSNLLPMLYNFISQLIHSYNESTTGEVDVNYIQVQTGYVALMSALKFTAVALLSRSNCVSFPRDKLMDLAGFFTSAPLNNYLISQLRMVDMDFSTRTYVAEPLLQASVAAVTTGFASLVPKALSGCYARFWPSPSQSISEVQEVRVSQDEDAQVESHLVINEEGQRATLGSSV